MRPFLKTLLQRSLKVSFLLFADLFKAAFPMSTARTLMPACVSQKNVIVTALPSSPFSILRCEFEVRTVFRGTLPFDLIV